jgi:hypothetical protein
VRNAGIGERDEIGEEHRCEDFSYLARLVHTARGKNDGRSRCGARGHRASAAR